ncbi:MAG: TetR/AcrR family transcriptional regulator [Lachnospiraceae bacterium]|nr:TetR/AcrR family transcriptional regulator [Lachnospiraceae bacterium]
MGEKSNQKRRFILETAREVFAEKGYRTVTMKDIVDACKISRGGLYLHFESTEEIFREILKLDEETEDASLDGKLDENSSPSDILAVFLKEQKKEILKKKSSLMAATYEFYFENKSDRKNNTLRKQFLTGVKVLENLIAAGMEAGEFYAEDPTATARNMMYVLEGLKIASQTVGVTEKAVDEEIMYLMSGLLVEE